MANKQVVPYQDKKSTKKVQIRNMFDGISSNYDLLNRVISGGIDIKWRKKVVALLLPKKPKKNTGYCNGNRRSSHRIGKNKS